MRWDGRLSLAGPHTVTRSAAFCHDRAGQFMICNYVTDCDGAPLRDGAGAYGAGVHQPDP